MPTIDRHAPLRFLSAAYQPDDWIAVFLKSYETSRTQQRVGPVSLFADSRFQAWLRAENASRANVYVSVNALTPHQRSRRRDTVRTIRHVFLDVDHDGGQVLRTIAARRDLPRPSFVIHSSRDRVHVLWQVAGFTRESLESPQKRLAGELGTDRAATSSAQLTRLPGFLNHKRVPSEAVSVECGGTDRVYTPADFPAVVRLAGTPTEAPRQSRAASAIGRARRYVSATPIAVAGRHGDVQTFRVCCRLVRGFALSDEDALEILAEWNAQCQPPWSEHELRAKLRHARRYGREPVAGLLEAQS